MKVDLITEDKSDLTVVNAARCSFDKEGWWGLCSKHNYLNCKSCRELTAGDTKLINYLADHNHWTPFGHPQEAFDISIGEAELTYFLLRANLSGFEWSIPVNSWTVRGSLYAWLMNTMFLPEDISGTIRQYLVNKYPVSYKALIGDFVEPKSYGEAQHIPCPEEDELKTYTVRIHVPIAVKRQLETHRRNFVMTDIEDFSQNEVSRRYVDTPPEIYTPVWRAQAKDKKQGSDANTPLPEDKAYLCNIDYSQMGYSLSQTYKSFNARGVAHEQSRFVLPLATYTTWWWTGSLKAYRRLFALRMQPDVQDETREVAELIYQAIP